MAARLAAAFVVVALALLAFGVPRAPAPSPCPESTQPDGARLLRVVHRLAHSREGAALLRRVGHPPLTCFGPVDDGLLRSDGVLVLSNVADDAAAAARLGHLLLHQLEGFHFDDSDARPCSERIAEALTAEARAHALELRLRRALAAGGRLLPEEVESAYWMAGGDDAGVEVLRRHFASAGPGGLADAYARRCREGRRGAISPSQNSAPGAERIRLQYSSSLSGSGAGQRAQRSATAQLAQPRRVSTAAARAPRRSTRWGQRSPGWCSRLREAQPRGAPSAPKSSRRPATAGHGSAAKRQASSSTQPRFASTVPSSRPWAKRWRAKRAASLRSRSAKEVSGASPGPSR